jgi:hypothetical protein
MTEPFLKTAAPAHLLGTERGEPSPMTEDATLARASYTYWLSPPTLVERPGMRLFSGRPGLQRQVAYELSLAESSRPDEAIREPIENWRFDPTEVAAYEAVLRSLLAAAEALDHAVVRTPVNGRLPI